MPFFAAVQKMGITVPAAIALGMTALSSSFVTAPSSKYFSMRASSYSTMASTNLDRAAARSTRQPAGVLSGGFSTLTMPVNCAPWPMGALSSAQAFPKDSLMALSSSSIVDDEGPSQSAFAGLGEHTAGVDLDAVGRVYHDDGRFDGT